MSAAIRCDVAVVGAGPVGTAVALELARGGVSSLLLERSLQPSRHPKMDFLNARTMEQYAALGLADDIRRHGVPSGLPFRFLWRRDLDGPVLSDWRSDSVDEQREWTAQSIDGTAPAEPYQRILGSTLEQLSRDACTASALVDFREGVEVCTVGFDTRGATLGIRDLNTGTHSSVAARFVVACDGARSRVRDSLGISTDEICPPITHTDVYLHSKDPRLTRDGMPFLTILGTGLTLVSRDGDHAWTATYPHLTTTDRATDPIEALQRRVGGPLAIDRIVHIATWEGRLGVARTYRRGPVFLAGDSAHRFFPTGGHGANTGLGDAANLGWKLAAYLHGSGGEELLDSYDRERRPVGLFAREMCADLLNVWQRFPGLTASGASDAQLAAYLGQHSFHVGNLGIHVSPDYWNSTVVHGEPARTNPRNWQWQTCDPSIAPGGRLPHVALEPGRSNYSELGDQWTLVGADPRVADVITRACAMGLAMVHRDWSGTAGRELFENRVVLVRPDQHIAWTGTRLPDDTAALLATVLGRDGMQASSQPARREANEWEASA